jgi:hypothetical protein
MADNLRMRVPKKMDGSLSTVSTVISASGPLCRADDKLRLNITSTDATATINFEGRILTVEGETNDFFQQIILTGVGAATPVDVPVTDGWIQGFAVYVVSGTITAGEMEGRVDLVRNSGSTLRTVMTLASGDLTNAKALGLGAFT